MNSGLALDCARGFAERVLASAAPSDAERVERAPAFLGEMRAGARAPLAGAATLAAAIADPHSKTSQGPQAEPSAPMSASASGSEPETPEHFAWRSLCHVLLSPNDFVYVD